MNRKQISSSLSSIPFQQQQIQQSIEPIAPEIVMADYGDLIPSKEEIENQITILVAKTIQELAKQESKLHFIHFRYFFIILLFL